MRHVMTDITLTKRKVKSAKNDRAGWMRYVLILQLSRFQMQ